MGVPSPSSGTSQTSRCVALRMRVKTRARPSADTEVLYSSLVLPVTSGSGPPLPSAAIALSRSLVLPGIGLLLLPIWFGDQGVYLAIPIAEALTFVGALVLVFRLRLAGIADS